MVCHYDGHRRDVKEFADKPLFATLDTNGLFERFSYLSNQSNTIFLLWSSALINASCYYFTETTVYLARDKTRQSKIAFEAWFRLLGITYNVDMLMQASEF